MLKNLVNIQNELKAPKSNYNSFGKYNYRSAEDILTAAKPILAKYNYQMTITDDVIAVGNRIYIKATVTISDSDGNTESVSALAREEETKKGMDASQITGTASSYARKYALNGLFLIDDTKDADTDAFHDMTTTTCRRNQMQDKKDQDAPVFDRTFMREHGADKITAREIARLTDACNNAPKSMNIEAALMACNRNSIEDINYTQYIALMTTLGAVA